MKKQGLLFYLIGFIFLSTSAQAITDRDPAAMAENQLLTKQEPVFVDENQMITKEELDFLIEQKMVGDELKGTANFVTVGHDNSCDYRVGSTKIQDAINDNHGEIRIAKGIYAENLYINTKNVKLLGGYADCSAASNDDYSSSFDAGIVPATGSGLPVIRVTGDSARQSLTLRNLTIRNGQSTSTTFSGGGISFYKADYFVTIQKTNILLNQGKWGGGISVRSGKTNIGIINSSISHNIAEDGGGIHCNGGNNSILLESGPSQYMSISENRATYDGGGAAITQGCRLTSYVVGGFIFNEANRHGGGIHASMGAEINLYGHQECLNYPSPICKGNNNKPNTFYQNMADFSNDKNGNGGAIYATGNNTKVTATNVKFESNSAFNGGAVYVTDGAEFETYAVNPKNCWENGRCNQFISNAASIQNGRGGAFFVKGGGKLSVLATHIERNVTETGSAFFIEGTGSELTLEGSYVVNNGDPDGYYYSAYAIYIINDAKAVIDFSTIADNNVPIYLGSIMNDHSSLNLFANIIHEQTATPALKSISPVSTSQVCNIVNTFGDMISNSSNIEDNPRFVDRDNNDYHIDAVFSPAVDYCFGGQYHYDNKDTDGDRRGWDDYTVSNIYGDYDVGADETYDNDIIFKNGF